MDTVGAVTVNIGVALVTGTLEAGKGILTGGIFVAVILAGDALVDLWLATILAVFVVTFLAVANTIATLHILAALDPVTLVLVLAIENASAPVARDWAIVVVLAHALVTLALLDASCILTAWVRIALFLVTAHLPAAIVPVIAFALETVALVDTCGMGMTIVRLLGALILVAILFTIAVFH